MVPVDKAFSYHLTHRTGWRDPVADTEWEQIFYHAHPVPAVPLLSIFWASLSDPLPFSASARITSLPSLQAAAERYEGVTGIENVRQAHFEATASEVTAQ
jgi:hypothetical protein